MLTSAASVGSVVTRREFVWKMGDFNRSSFTTPVDPVESLVGYTGVLFLTSWPVLLWMKSLHFNPIRGVLLSGMILIVAPGVAEASGAFR